MSGVFWYVIALVLLVLVLFLKLVLMPLLAFVACCVAGIIITIAFSQAIGLTAVSFVIDRKTGNLDRTFAAGVRPAEIMCGQIITYMLILAVEIGLLLIVALNIFKLAMHG